MSWDFDKLHKTIQEEKDTLVDNQKLEAFRIKYLGRKGIIQDIYASLGSAPKEERPAIGKSANDLKNLINAIIQEKKEIF